MSTSIAPRRVAAILLAALPLARPLVAQSVAQSGGSDSVEVRRGDTLWGLASARLGSPWRWPEIREANAERIANPHWIYPGQRLRMPGDGAAVAESTAAPTDSEATAVTTTVFADAAPVTPASAPAAAPAPARVGAWPPVDSAAWFVVRDRLPYIADVATVKGAGTLVDGFESVPNGFTHAARRFQLRDRLVITLPRGADASATTLVLARRGPEVGGLPIIVPTGLVRVEGTSGSFVTAHITDLFDAVEAGDMVLAYPAGGLPQPEHAGPSRAAHVVWIPGSAELPTVGSAVMLGVGAADGVGAGDQFELVGDDRHIGNGVLPGARVAVVRVMRVSARGATAVVISQNQPGIRVGMSAKPLR